uniref:Uncharacterized protein n=1 Tax=Arundo donax TaxID=35708 RepID=A0A0A9C473_ARUDO
MQAEVTRSRASGDTTRRRWVCATAMAILSAVGRRNETGRITSSRTSSPKCLQTRWILRWCGSTARSTEGPTSARKMEVRPDSTVGSAASSGGIRQVSSSADPRQWVGAGLVTAVLRTTGSDREMGTRGGPEMK